MVSKQKEILILENGRPNNPEVLEKIKKQIDKSEWIFASVEFAQCSRGRVSYFSTNVFRNKKREKVVKTTLKQLRSELETLKIMADEQLMGDIRKGLKDLREGKTISF